MCWASALEGAPPRIRDVVLMGSHWPMGEKLGNIAGMLWDNSRKNRHAARALLNNKSVSRMVSP